MTREDAIKTLKELWRETNDHWYEEVYKMAIKALEDLPSADRPQGEWIKHKNAEEICGTLISNYECSLCHEWQTLISNFCPSCGARMKGGDDEVR